jgi:aarF domain-containing kinase
MPSFAKKRPRSFGSKPRGVQNASCTDTGGPLSFLQDEHSLVGNQRSDVPDYQSTILSSLFASAVVPPSRRGVFVLGALAFSISYVGCRLQQSEPLRRATYFWRHAGPIVLHYKWVKGRVKGKSQVERDFAFEQLHDQYNQPALAIALHLKGLYVKLGQIMSIRPDALPRQYVDAFSICQDSAPAADTDTMQKRVMESLLANCPKAFTDTYETVQLDPGPPLGSASIGQVHKATLFRKDGSAELVAVKIMHDNAQQRFAHDFSVFRWLCKIALPSWTGFLDALHQQVMTEFDYRLEAQNLATVRGNMLNSPYRRRVEVPKPFHDVTCKNILVMELLDGQKVVDYIREQFTSAIGSRELAQQFLEKRRHEVTTGEDAGSNELLPTGAWAKWRLFRLSRKCRKVVHLLVDSHGYQIFASGKWNGDPHFGTYWDPSPSQTSHLTPSTMRQGTVCN